MNLPEGMAFDQREVAQQPDNNLDPYRFRGVRQKASWHKCACGKPISRNQPACLACRNLRTNYASPEEAQAAVEVQARTESNGK